MSAAIIYRPQCETNFTTLPNELFNFGHYCDLKPRDVAVLNYLFSRQDYQKSGKTWNIDCSAISNALNIGESTARRALKMLKDKGFASYQRFADGTTKWQVKLPFTIMGHNIVITCSIGVVFFPNDANSSEQLFKLADAALQQAKQEGRNQVQFITLDIVQTANRRMILLSALNFALMLNEFVLMLQPQFDGAQKLISAEALLRWEPNGQTMAFPDEFIPLAEENGSIVQIGFWITRAVCSYIKNWLDLGLMQQPQYIAINISPKQFVQPDFVDRIRQIVAESGIEPHNLELELTEGLLIKNIDESVSKLEKLKSYGFRISIDDFGTGYSSLAYLKRFPLNTLKIDRSFITAVDKDSSNAGIVEAIIAMAKALKFDTVAEGVETQAEFDFLQRQHCDLYQGYFFSKPLHIEKFDQLLRSRQSD